MTVAPCPRKRRVRPTDLHPIVPRGGPARPTQQLRIRETMFLAPVPCFTLETFRPVSALLRRIREILGSTRNTSNNRRNSRRNKNGNDRNCSKNRMRNTNGCSSGLLTKREGNKLSRSTSSRRSDYKKNRHSGGRRYRRNKSRRARNGLGLRSRLAL